MELTAGLYFPEPYSAPLHMRVLNGIQDLVENSKITVHVTDLPSPEISKARVDDTDILGHPVEMHWDDHQLREVIEGHYVQFVEFRLRGSWRRVSLMTFLHDDANLLFDIGFELTETETTEYRPLIPKDIGESRLLGVIDRIDPFWAVVAVEGFAPDIEDVLGGHGDFRNGYYGTRLLDKLERPAWAKVLRECPKVIHLPRGGVYTEWSFPRWWEHPGYKELLSTLETALRALSD